MALPPKWYQVWFPFLEALSCRLFNVLIHPRTVPCRRLRVAGLLALWL